MTESFIFKELKKFNSLDAKYLWLHFNKTMKGLILPKQHNSLTKLPNCCRELYPSKFQKDLRASKRNHYK